MRSPNTRAAWSGLGSSSRIEKAATVAAANASTNCLAGARQPFGYDSQSGASSSAANFVQPASATAAPRAHARGREPEAPDQEGGHDRVVRVRVGDVERERVGSPREGQHRRQSRPAEPPPDEGEPENAERVEEERGRVCRPELVPLPGPAESRVAGQVGEVGHGAVRVAPRVGRLAAAVRLDPLADLALGVGDAARLLVLLHRHVPVRHLPVRDPVRAHDAREADVDHASLRLHVQAHPEPGEEDRGAGEHPDRPDRWPGARRPVAAGDPDAAAEQVDERRIRERGAPEDLARR